MFDQKVQYLTIKIGYDIDLYLGKFAQSVYKDTHTLVDSQASLEVWLTIRSVVT